MWSPAGPASSISATSGGSPASRSISPRRTAGLRPTIPVSSGPGVPGSRRVRPYRSSSASGSATSEAAAHSSTASAVAGVAAARTRAAWARAASADALVSRTGTAASPRARWVTDRSASRSSSRSTRAGAGSRQARSSRSSSRWSASVPSGWARATPRTTSASCAGIQPAAPSSQPATASVSAGDSPRPSRPAAVATGASQSSRLSSAPEANTSACCHSPGAAITPVLARMAASGWMPPPGPCPAARSNSWKLESALGGERLGQDSGQVVPGVTGPVAVGGERHPVPEVLAQQIGDGGDPPDVLADVVAHHQDRPLPGHGPADRRQQLGEDAAGPAGVEERLGARAVDGARRRRAGQLRQLGAVHGAGAPQLGTPQLHRQQLTEVLLRGAGDQGMREIVARAAGVVGPGEHHLRGDGRAGRLAGSVRERDRVRLRLVRAGAGQQPARRLVEGAALLLLNNGRRAAGRDGVNLLPAVPAHTVFV